MDLALAHAVRARLADGGTTLDDWQLRGLVHACRDAKEKLLAAARRREAPVVVLGRGARSIGGAVRTEVTRDEVEAALVDGFFPERRARRPAAQPRGASACRSSACRTPATRRSRATSPAFLGRHREVAPDGPTAVLFNGGVMSADRFRDRMVEVLARLARRRRTVRVLAGTDLDLAVARGAASYGLARRGRGVRIRGGTARAYYVGVETAVPAVPGMAPPVKALCVAPFGMEEGSERRAAGRGVRPGRRRAGASSASSARQRPPRRHARHGRRALGRGRARGARRRSRRRSTGAAEPGGTVPGARSKAAGHRGRHARALVRRRA